MTLIRPLAELLYPPKCPFCGHVLERGEKGLCALCRENLPWTAQDEVRYLENGLVCLSPLWYSAGVRKAVHRFKFQGGQNHAQLLGALMERCLLARCPEGADLITWVPLSRRRLRERGYDQAELLARRTAQLAGLEAAPTLEKTRQGRSQSQLENDAQRRANAAGAYRALSHCPAAGKRVVLVDDVVTSGSTLSECARCLRQAGALSVTALTLARAR